MCAATTKQARPCRRQGTWGAPGQKSGLQCRTHAEQTARSRGWTVIYSPDGGRRRQLAPKPSPRTRRGVPRGEAEVIAAAAQARDSHELHVARMAAITQHLYTPDVFVALRAARNRLTQAAETAIANANEQAFERRHR